MRSSHASLFILFGLLGVSGPLFAQESAEPETTPAVSAGDAVQGAKPWIGNRVDYEIEARYNQETHRLDGSETIRWTNGSDAPTSELWFHVYWNAFSNSRSTFALDGSAAHKDGEWGWSRVKTVKVDGADVFASFEYAQPDTEGSPGYESRAEDGELYLTEDDRSVCKVTLPTPIAPGETAEIELSWTSLVPRVRRRTGYKGDFLLIAQWFPKLGVFQGADGWNCHQFHSSTEFFSDYGSYRVTLDLPEAYADKVGGSGVLVATRKKDGDRVEVVFEAPSATDQALPDMFDKLPVVHDFTWTADTAYVVEEFHFTWDEWSNKSENHKAEVERVRAALGPDAQIELRDVDVTVLIHPERRGQARRHYEATANALFFYGLWFGEYPYQHITVVDPIWGDNRAGGMEYPTLFTAGTSMFTAPDEYRPESVTVHEAGHQFWYGLVGNNEFESAWMDEGFNSYTDSETLLRAYGPQRKTTRYSRLPFDGVRRANLPSGGKLGAVLGARQWTWDFDLIDKVPVLNKVASGKVSPLRSSGMVDWWRDQPFSTLCKQWDDPRWGDRSGYLSSADEDPIDMPAWMYKDRGSYRANSYPRPAVALRTMVGLVGFDAFLRGMRHYAAEYRYDHPEPEDFFRAFNEGAGVDISWYFEDAFQSTKTIDWSVGLRQKRASEAKGWFQGEDGRFRTIEDIKKEADELAADEGVEPEATAGEELAEVEGEDEDEDKAEDKPKRPYLIDITLQRRGELCLPLPWQVVFEGAEDEEDEVVPFLWTREEQLANTWLRVRIEDARKVKSVVLDPERLYYIDGNMSDNQWYADGDKVAPLRWTERVLNQYGHLLHWYGGIGG